MNHNPAFISHTHCLFRWHPGGYHTGNPCVFIQWNSLQQRERTNYCYTQHTTQNTQHHGWLSQTDVCVVREARQEKITAYASMQKFRKVQNQAKLVCGVRGQSGWALLPLGDGDGGGCVTGQLVESTSRSISQYGYTGPFTLWKFKENHSVSDLCNFCRMLP